MSNILSINVNTTGLIGDQVNPRRCTLVTTDNLATITAAGYLNNENRLGNTILPTDIFEILFNYNPITQAANFGIFQVTYSQSSGFTLVEWVNSADVLLPVVSGDIPIFNGTNGQIKDSGVAFSNSSDVIAPLFHGTAVAGDLVSINNANKTIQDSGIVAANVLQSAIANPDNPSDLIWYDVTATAAALATAGKVNIQVSSGTKQYKVRNVLFNYAAAGLSGGSGDRLLAITDGTTVYNNAGITAALLGTPVNTVWGGSGNPLPGTVAMNTSTVAGANLYLQYTGGTTDYTTGQVVVSVLVQRVA